jgi:uncharacterized protein (UPF0210 family)
MKAHTISIALSSASALPAFPPTFEEDLMLRNTGSSAHVLPFLAHAIFLAAFLLATVVPPAAAQEKPKVRTITAFIRLDPGQYKQQISDTLTMLRNAKARFGLAGYEVQTIRITTQPFPEYTRGMSKEAALALFHDLDVLAKQDDVSIAIGPALMDEKDDPGQADLLREILGQTGKVYGSVVVAGADGIHWKAVHEAAETIKYLEDHGEKGLGNFRFAAIANVPAYTPFYPASYHQGLGHQFAVALESANVVAAVMAVQRDQEVTRQALISVLGKYAYDVEGIASKIDQETGWTYMGLDLSPAPMKYASIGSAMAGFTGGRFGTSGTLTAVSTITSALRDISVKKVGYSGVMMPVMEDTRLAQLWGEGAISMDQLLAYSTVCGTGLDTIPLPGDVTTQQLERIVGDVATLSAKLSKPLSARLLPVAGAKPGDQTMFDDPNLVNTVLQPLP